MNSPMMNEKTATPIRRMNAPMALSWMETGLMSPNPMVDKVVKAKYHTLISRSIPVSPTSYG